MSDFNALKEAGNALLKSGDLAGAVAQYTDALAAAHAEGDAAAVAVALSNRSLALLRLGRAQAAHDDACACAAADPQYKKGAYRIQKAEEALAKAGGKAKKVESTDLAPSAPPASCPVAPPSAPSAEHTTVATAAASLARDGYAIVDGFVGSAVEARRLHERVRALPMAHGALAWQRGAVGGGRTGGAQHAVLSHVRGDSFLEVSGCEPPDAGLGFVAPLVRRFDTLLRALAPCLGLDLALHSLRSQPMLACYPAGENARYIRHVDNPDDNGRVITVIYYLNADWTPADGGQLRLHPQAAAAAGAGRSGASTIDVDPVADRLVLFWSDARMPHEVLPAQNQDRWALSVWYMDRAVLAKAQDEEGARDAQQAAEEEKAQEKSFAYLHAVQLAASRAFLSGCALLPSFWDSSTCAALLGTGKPLEGDAAKWCSTECGTVRVHWSSAISCCQRDDAFGDFEAKIANLHYQLGTASQPALQASAHSDTMVVCVQPNEGGGTARVRLPKIMYSTYVAMLCCGDTVSDDSSATIGVYRMRGSTQQPIMEMAFKPGNLIIVETTLRVHLELEVAAGRSCTVLARWFFKPTDTDTARNAGKSTEAVIAEQQSSYSSKIVLCGSSR